MKVTVIKWGIIELGYPYRNYEQALDMFIREYPNAPKEEINTYAGCIRTFKVY